MAPRSKSSIRLWAVAFWLLLWQIAAMAVGQDFLLAAPLAVLGRLFALARTAAFWSAAAHSLARILSGFFLGFCVGILAAALAARFTRVREWIAPLWVVLRAIPVASFIVLALIWLPSKRLSALIAFLIVFPVIYAAASAEIDRVDAQLTEMALLMRMPVLRRIAYLYLLPALRGFEGACVSAMGLAWKSGIAAELISIPAGSIGEKLYAAKVYLMTGDLFAWTILIVLLSAACARLIVFALRLLRRALEGM